jgi:hypothetical protein
MLRKPFFILVISSLSILSHAIASDPPIKKRPWLMYAGGGLTHNTVYGSMVKRNIQFSDDDLKMTDKAGFLLSVQLEKQVSDLLFIRTGIGYIQKQVNPMQNAWAVYWDRLKTGYLSIPLLAGIHFIPPDQRVNLAISAGPSFNFRITDNSYVGPDRVDFKTSLISTSINAGATLSCRLESKTRIVLQYNYAHDISNTYIETLWWSSAEPNKEFTYKYKTSSFSLGFQWPL